MTKPVRLAQLVVLILLILSLLLIMAVRFVPGLQISSYRVLINSLSGTGGPSATQNIIAALTTAEGIELSIFADHLPKARMLKITPTGQLLVSSPSTGAVYLLSDENGDGQADSTTPVINNLNRPHGIDLYDDGKTTWLYIAETNAVGRVAMDWSKRKALGPYEPVIKGLSEGGGHRTKTIRFGPDGWLYLTAGSSCNVCEETDNRRAAMMRFLPDGTEGQIYA